MCKGFKMSMNTTLWCFINISDLNHKNVYFAIAEHKQMIMKITKEIYYIS